MDNDNLKKNNKYGKKILACLFIILTIAGCGLKSKVHHVGILAGTKTLISLKDGFISKLNELGYIEGKNITYDIQELEGDTAGQERIIKKFITDKADLIYVFATDAAVTAKKMTSGTGIPVVFAYATIENTGLVESVRHPGGNITGVRFNGPDIILKEFEILLEIAPDTRRIWIIRDQKYAGGAGTSEALKSAIRKKRLKVIETYIASLEDLRDVLKERGMRKDIGIDAIQTVPDFITLSPAGFSLLSEFALKHRVPISGGTAFSVKLGSAFTTIPESSEIGALAATLADKIFKGSKAGDIPVITPKTHLRINYKLIRQLGLKVSDSLLSQADEIIR